MDLTDYLIPLLLLCLSVAEAIKCKCTKESETVTCYDGVCEMEGGSCLMLDHPTMGVHYTCHTRGLKDGACRNKTSKSGVSVRICGCDAMDFCNYSYWPDKAPRSVAEEQRLSDVIGQTEVNSASFPVSIPIILSLMTSLFLF